MPAQITVDLTPEIRQQLEKFVRSRTTSLKQMMALSYEELSFCISDSYSYQSVTRTHINPSVSALQHTISSIDAETWEAINKVLLRARASEGIEKGRAVRIDSTVTESHIHPPSDSSLLGLCSHAFPGHGEIARRSAARLNAIL